MADAVTSTTLMDSDRVAIIQLTNTSDGTGEAAVKKVDVSALSDSSTGQACTGVRLAKIVLNSDYTDSEDFTEFGGIRNTAAASGKTGDIMLTTTGHSDGDSYVIVLTLYKDFD